MSTQSEIVVECAFVMNVVYLCLPVCLSPRVARVAYSVVSQKVQYRFLASILESIWLPDKKS